MDKIIDYKVVDGVSIEELQEQVNLHMRLGWHLQGGVAVYDRLGYYQAMIKYEPPKLDW